MKAYINETHALNWLSRAPKNQQITTQNKFD